MAKEFHITYSCETVENGFKPLVSRIQKMMKDGRAELISKSEDFDGYIDIMFHQIGTRDSASKLCSTILDSMKNETVRIGVSVSEHNPKVSIETKDVKDINEFKSFVATLGDAHGAKDINQDSEDKTILIVDFEKSSQRQSFQNDYTAKAGNFMKKGHSSVEIFPDWEDITILQKNNYDGNKKNTKFGY